MQYNAAEHVHSTSIRDRESIAHISSSSSHLCKILVVAALIALFCLLLLLLLLVFNCVVTRLDMGPADCVARAMGSARDRTDLLEEGLQVREFGGQGAHGEGAGPR